MRKKSPILISSIIVFVGRKAYRILESVNDVLTKKRNELPSVDETSSEYYPLIIARDNILDDVLTLSNTTVGLVRSMSSHISGVRKELPHDTVRRPLSETVRKWMSELKAVSIIHFARLTNLLLPNR